jgi:hypothetical protein
VRAAIERMFSWFWALCSWEYHTIKEHERHLRFVKARTDEQIRSDAKREFPELIRSCGLIFLNEQRFARNGIAVAVFPKRNRSSLRNVPPLNGPSL